MSKLKDTLLMMAVEKETFKIGDKTFQIIEVVEAEQPQPDYSHLVGKWIRCTELENGWNSFFEVGQWYKVEGINNNRPQHKGFDFNSQSWAKFNFFDLTNPQDTNPDEVKKILVPKEIVVSEDVDGLNLHFGNNQALYVYKGADGYGVLSEADREPIQCELIKCERAELKKGDLAFRTNSNDGEFNSQGQYCVIINEDEYCYIERDKDVAIGMSKPHHWYKLQPIEQ